MPGSRPGHRIASAWLPAEFHRAVGLLAAARGESKSDLIRRALVREAINPQGGTDEQREEQAAAAPR